MWQSGHTKNFKETEWDAKTEVRGQASHGAVWVADVLATKGKHHIAFEVQWSPQTLSETSQRQSLYQDSNVRCLWLFKRPSDIQASKEVPSVLIDVTLDPLTAWVWIPIATIGSYMRDSEAKKADYLWNQKIELRRFIRGCLARKFFWAPGLNQTVPLEIWTAEQECWKCHRPTSIITSLNFCLDGIALGAKSISMKLEDFDNPAGIACLTDALKTAELRSHGIGVVKQRFSRTRGHAYLSNGCVHCDALQGAFFEHQVWHEAAPTLTVRCRMVEELFSDESQDTPYRWAFDERFEEVESIKALTSDPISNSVMSA